MHWMIPHPTITHIWTSYDHVLDHVSAHTRRQCYVLAQQSTQPNAHTISYRLSRSLLFHVCNMMAGRKPSHNHKLSELIRAQQDVVKIARQWTRSAAPLYPRFGGTRATVHLDCPHQTILHTPFRHTHTYTATIHAHVPHIPHLIFPSIYLIP